MVKRLTRDLPCGADVTVGVGMRLLIAYLDFKGDMDQIMESVLCVQYTDEPRIRNIIQKAIESKEIPAYSAFVKESKQKMNARKRRAQEEAKEAELSRKELGLEEGVDKLKALIQSRQKDRQKEMDSFLAQMDPLTVVTSCRARSGRRQR